MVLQPYIVLSVW